MAVTRFLFFIDELYNFIFILSAYQCPVNEKYTYDGFVIMDLPMLLF